MQQESLQWFKLHFRMWNHPFWGRGTIICSAPFTWSISTPWNHVEVAKIQGWKVENIWNQAYTISWCCIVYDYCILILFSMSVAIWFCRTKSSHLEIHFSGPSKTTLEAQSLGWMMAIGPAFAHVRFSSHPPNIKHPQEIAYFGICTYFGP